MTALGDIATTSPTEKSWLRFYKTAARQWNKLEPKQRAAIGEMFVEVRREAAQNRLHSRVRPLTKGEEGMPALYSINPRVNGRELRVLYVQALGAYCVLNIVDGVEKDRGVSARNTEMYRSVTQARWASLTQPEAFVSCPIPETEPSEPEKKKEEVPVSQPQPQPQPQEQKPKVLTLDVIPRVGCGHLTAWLLRTLAMHPTGKDVSLHELHFTIPRKLTYTDVAKLAHAGLTQVTANKRVITSTITDFGREVAAMAPTRVVVTGDHSTITVFKDAREDPFASGYIGTALTARHIVLTALQVVTSDGEYISETTLYDLLDKRDQVLVPPQSFYQTLRSLVQDGIATDRYVHIGGTAQRCQYRIKPAPATAPAVTSAAEPDPPAAATREEEKQPMATVITPQHTIEAGPQQAPLAALLRTAEDFCEALGQSIRGLPRENRTAAVGLLEAIEDFIAKARNNG